MKFEYLGSEYDLIEIVGEENISQSDRGDNMIISKDGMVRLLQKFPAIDCTFGELESFEMKGETVLAVQAAAFNREHENLPIGRSYGEISSRNADPFALSYPVLTIENRARNRAVLRHLGIEGVFSEEEIAALPKRSKPEMPAVQEGSSEAEKRRKLINEVKEFTSKYNKDDDWRRRLYCVALGIDKGTPKNEVSKMLTIEALEKALAIAKEKLGQE